MIGGSFDETIMNGFNVNLIISLFEDSGIWIYSSVHDLRAEVVACIADSWNQQQQEHQSAERNQHNHNPVDRLCGLSGLRILSIGLVAAHEAE